MEARTELIIDLQAEMERADFSTEEGQDDSYQYTITRLTEVFKESEDDSLDLHDIVKIVNLLDDLELTLLDAYMSVIEYLEEKEK